MDSGADGGAGVTSQVTGQKHKFARKTSSNIRKSGRRNQQIDRFSPSKFSKKKRQNLCQTVDDISVDHSSPEKLRRVLNFDSPSKTPSHNKSPRSLYPVSPDKQSERVPSPTLSLKSHDFDLTEVNERSSLFIHGNLDDDAQFNRLFEGLDGVASNQEDSLPSDFESSIVEDNDEEESAPADKVPKVRFVKRKTFRTRRRFDRQSMLTLSKSQGTPSQFSPINSSTPIQDNENLVPPSPIIDKNSIYQVSQFEFFN